MEIFRNQEIWVGRRNKVLSGLVQNSIRRMQIVLNDAAYGMETQEYSTDLSLMELAEWQIDDRIWMQKRMAFDVVDLQKHQKANHFKCGGAA